MRQRLSRSVLVLACASLASVTPAATYSVGPGQPLASVGDVPWEAIAPGDLVEIHWRPAPYREKFALDVEGTAAQPVIVRGIPGPGGELPVLDGADATTRLAIDTWSETRGIIKIGASNRAPDAVPSFITIEGLEIRGARDANAFTDDAGVAQRYSTNASSIYVELGENVTVRNCTLHDCGNGFFVASSDAAASRDILVQGCRLYDNGNVGSIYEHQSYTAAIGITFEGNWFGPLLPGALGNNLKDRSAGLVVRHDWIESGNRQLDLVDAEDSQLIRDDPSYRDTWVYGNVLIETEGAGNRQILHYGGDGTTVNYRRGTLHLYNNTIVSYRTDRTTLMRLSTALERCDARGNVVHVASAAGSTLSLLDQDGVLDWSHQWTKPGWVPCFGTLRGTIFDDSTSITGTSPGFLDEAAQDFRLARGSPCVDAGAALEAAALPDHDVVRQYRKHQSVEPRPRDATLDIGAYELCVAVPPTAIVANLRVEGDALTWDALAGASSYDVVRGDVVQMHAAGLGASVDACLADEIAATTLVDATPPPASGGWWYLVRASSCAGAAAGTWDSSSPSLGAPRDGALVAACP